MGELAGLIIQLSTALSRLKQNLEHMALVVNEHQYDHYARAWMKKMNESSEELLKQLRKALLESLSSLEAIEKERDELCAYLTKRKSMPIEDRVLVVTGDGLSQMFNSNSGLSWRVVGEPCWSWLVQCSGYSFSAYSHVVFRSIELIDLSQSSKMVIERRLFQRLENLVEVRFPPRLETIGYGAFAECTALSVLDFPATLKGIEGHAFTSCESLVDVILPLSLTYLGDVPFTKCRKLRSLNLPKGLCCLGYSAFTECPNLRLLIVESETFHAPFLQIRARDLRVVGSDRVVEIRKMLDVLPIQLGFEYDFQRMGFGQVSRLDD